MTETLPQMIEQTVTVSTGEDDVRQYLQEIRRYPLLTVQQEQELARRCAEGDEEAIKRMVTCNLRLVVSVAREYAGRGVPLLDLIQEGSIGLIAAAKKFDYTLDFRFSTYATKWIRQGVTRCLMNHGSLIRVPVHTNEQMRRLISAQAAFHQEFGRAPDQEELAQRMEVPVSKVKKLLELMPEVNSIDAPAGEDGEGSLAMSLVDPTPEPQQEMIRRELKATLDHLLGGLTERQQRILRLHYGMEDGFCYTLEQISKMEGVSKERVRQVEKQAMKRLQETGAAFGLEEYLE